jgi:hypothetical protein
MSHNTGQKARDGDMPDFEEGFEAVLKKLIIRSSSWYSPTCMQTSIRRRPGIPDGTIRVTRLSGDQVRKRCGREVYTTYDE